MSYSNYLLFSFLLLIIFITKNVYLFLAFLLLLIPKNKFKSNKYTSVFLIIFFMFMLYFIWNKINDLYGYSFSVNDSQLNRNLIIHSPIKYFIIFINTLIKNSNSYFSTMIGRYLGWLEINIGNFYYYCFVLLFIIFLLWDYDDRIKIDVKLLSFIIIVITFGMILTALYLVWTPHKYTIIAGVQGRYFIPILLLLFMASNCKSFKAQPNLKNKSLFLIISMLHIGILYEIFNKFYLN